MAIFSEQPRCWNGGGIHVESLDHLVEIFVVRISAYDGEGLDEKLCNNLVYLLWIYNGCHYFICCCVRCCCLQHCLVVMSLITTVFSSK